MPTSDFWLFAGIAILSLGVGQCARMGSDGRAVEELARSCAKTIAAGSNVPDICASIKK